MRLRVVLAVTTLFAGQEVSAQCKVKTESNEAKLLAFYSAISNTRKALRATVVAASRFRSKRNGPRRAPPS